MEDLSDNEREEQLRRWWAENWLWIVGGIALGLGALAAWQYWHKAKWQSAERDESAYMSVLDSLGKNDATAAAKQADDLRGQNPKSAYADQADLALARALVDQRKYDDAAKRLRTVADGSRDPQLRQVALTRLARVLAEQGKHDEALALLDVAKAGAFAPVYHEIRGDILSAKGDAAAARKEYETALATDNTGEGPAIDTRYVELKRDSLATVASTAAPAATAPAATPAGEPAATGGATP
ncbi:MAG TPA: tetratricopeptide repeat protein [Steroidobacteraceae bacterium]|nr:tetratricopeptide repeat protein [Steroidobacteraceae bacterium]